MAPIFPQMSSTTDYTNEAPPKDDPDIWHDDDLRLFSDDERLILFSVFLVLMTISLFGNLAAIYAIVRRNYRRFQKTCIISLALSDILSTIAIGLTNIVDVVDDLKIWPLDTFFCQFLPMCQMTGILASSATLIVIAIDRYRNVIYALNKSWNPRLSFCLLSAAAIWAISFSVSSPVFAYYHYYLVEVDRGIVGVCVMNKPREVMIKYDAIMVAVIFLPLLLIFIWCYYNIARLVWKHRKPLFAKKELEEKVSSSSKTFAPQNTNKKTKTQDDVRVEKKIRTFKIIISLMIVFILCRLPYFATQILKPIKTSFSDSACWVYAIKATLALHIINCFLNPLLYTFLHFTIKIWYKIENFFLDFLCFCCSRREFESFEKENPFVINNCDLKRNSKVRFEQEEKY